VKGVKRALSPYHSEKKKERNGGAEGGTWRSCCQVGRDLIKGPSLVARARTGHQGKVKDWARETDETARLSLQ